MSETEESYTSGGWQVVGPESGPDGEYWIWSASGDYGRRSLAGQAATKDRARLLAESAFHTLNPSRTGVA